MLGIGITLYQVIARDQDGKTIRTWPLTRNQADALRLKATLEREDAEYVADCACDGYAADRAVFSIFAADADFFA